MSIHYTLRKKKLTRVRILPTGVESKNSIGALKIDSVNFEKKALEAFNPKRAVNKDLEETKRALAVEINA